MVSVRRRKLINPLHPVKHGEKLNKGKSPSISPTATHANEEPIAKAWVQIDPENPMEVHSYLMMLKENNQLEIKSIPMAENLSTKELMEKHYPHIFQAFPQNSNAFQPDLLLAAVKNLVSIDHNTVSPEHIKGLAELIVNLESQGFDCRFIRSELLVVSFVIKQHLDIILARQNLIAARAANLKKTLEAATTARHGFWNHTNQRGPVFPSIHEEYLETVLNLHKELLANTEMEAARLCQVFHRICNLLRERQ